MPSLQPVPSFQPRGELCAWPRDRKRIPSHRVDQSSQFLGTVVLIPNEIGSQRQVRSEPRSGSSKSGVVVRRRNAITVTTSRICSNPNVDRSRTEQQLAIPSYQWNCNPNELRHVDIDNPLAVVAGRNKYCSMERAAYPVTVEGWIF